MKHVLTGLVLWGALVFPLIAEQPVSVGFYEFGLLYDNGKGVDKDVIDALAKRTGKTLTGSLMARARIWKDIESGDLDMSVSGIQTPERDLFAWFVPYLSVKIYAVVSSKVAEKVKSPEQFLANPALRWGVVTSFKHGAVEDLWLSQMHAAGRVEESGDASTLFKKLAQGRIDGVFAQPPIYKKYLADYGIASSVVVQDWAPQEGGVIGSLIFSKKRFTEAEVGVFRKAIQGMRDDGTLRSIYLRYLSAAEVQQLLDF